MIQRALYLFALIAAVTLASRGEVALAQPAAIDPAATGTAAIGTAAMQPADALSASRRQDLQSGSSSSAQQRSRAERFVHLLPKGLEALERRALWHRGVALEEKDRFLAAVELYKELTRVAPEVAFGYWKVSRNIWRHAEALPPEAKSERLPLFERAKVWAARGLEIDSNCAECMLWKFAAMGRIGTTRGILSSLGGAPEMRDLLERGIQLRPTYADAHYNTALGNLYYAAAVFYRVVPDWRWLGWAFGVKGDLDRSLEMIRHALQISPLRVDYNVEQGAILACYGEREGAEWASTKSRNVLSRSSSLPIVMDQDPLDLEHAQILLREPSKACGYSRDGWIDVEREKQHAKR